LIYLEERKMAAAGEINGRSIKTLCVTGRLKSSHPMLVNTRATKSANVNDFVARVLTNTDPGPERSRPLPRSVEILMADSRADAIALLKADHRKVEGLFEQFEAAKGAEKKQALAKQICTELTVHATIEEEIFYPACKGNVEDDLLNEGYVEHDGAKVLIAEIEAGHPDEQFYDSKVKVLSEQIEHHVGEEERPSTGIFSQARAAGLDMGALGVQLAARKKALTARFVMAGVPAPESRTFVGAEVAHSTPVDKAH
jgi:hemerythrin superfamily protein